MDVQPTNLQQLLDSINVNMDQISEGMFSNTLLNLCHKELRQFRWQKGDYARCP